jgi:hypothetical protein
MKVPRHCPLVLLLKVGEDRQKRGVEEDSRK